jgi:hypothetical protein
MSEALDKFTESFRRRDKSRVEDYDLEALSRLGGEERHKAEIMLIKRLKKMDPRVPRALALIDAKSAPGPLKDILPSCSGKMLVEAVMALCRIYHFKGAADELIRALSCPEADTRLLAAYWLREFPSPSVSRVLLDIARNDADREVRVTAAMSLMILHELLDSPYGTGMRDLLSVLEIPDPLVRDKACSELKALTGAAAE